MKRIVSLVLTFVMCLSLCACGDAGEGEPITDAFTTPDDYVMVMSVSINPQIRLYIDENGIVVAVEPVNDDAKKIIDDIAFEDLDYQKVVSEFITAANSKGYIKEDANIEFEVVENKNDKMDADDVLEKSSRSVKDTASNLHISVEVVSKPYLPGKTPDHKHSFEAATCIAPKTCKTCGAADGSANGHDWRAATCIAPKTCKTCGATDGSANGHDWRGATCIAPKTCKTCGATDGSANGHDYVDGVCSVCGGAQDNYKGLNTGKWTATQVVGNYLYIINLEFNELFLGCSYGVDINTLDSAFRDQLLQSYEQDKNALTVVDGVYYYTGMGDGGSITYVVSGNSVAINCEDYIHLKIMRVAGDRLMIAESDLLGNPSGIILTWCD